MSNEPNKEMDMVNRVIRSNMQQMEHNLKKAIAPATDTSKVDAFMKNTKDLIDKELKKQFKM